MHRLVRLLPLCAVLALLLGADKRGGGSPLLGTLPQHGVVTVSANGLHIQPGKDVNYLRFDGGVEIKGPGFSLRADVVEMDVRSSSLGLSEVKTPKLTEPPERVIADPGSAVQKMANEIRGPSAKLEPSALQRIAASGQIDVAADGAELTTDTVFSTDGGQSWSTGGPAQLKLSGQAHGAQGTFSAGLISFNAGTQELLARGAVHGVLAQGQQPPLSIQTGELRGNLKTGTVEIAGGVQATSGTTQLATAMGAQAPPVRFNLKTRELDIDGPFNLSDSQRELRMSGAGASASLGSGQQAVTASGPVHVTSGADDLELTASKLEAVLDPLKLTASGKVHLRYGGSAYDAEQAVLTRQGKKLVVDIRGPQSGRINLDSFKQPKRQ
jgi:hypothetical protein